MFVWIKNSLTILSITITQVQKSKAIKEKEFLKKQRKRINPEKNTLIRKEVV